MVAHASSAAPASVSMLAWCFELASMNSAKETVPSRFTSTFCWNARISRGPNEQPAIVNPFFSSSKSSSLEPSSSIDTKNCSKVKNASGSSSKSVTSFHALFSASRSTAFNGATAFFSLSALSPSRRSTRRPLRGGSTGWPVFALTEDLRLPRRVCPAPPGAGDETARVGGWGRSIRGDARRGSAAAVCVRGGVCACCCCCCCCCCCWGVALGVCWGTLWLMGFWLRSAVN
mmetsp:Transcript_57205/g.114779  ORF Transcript_57205/g.114779 Transcript_57205/m.114779 type:complete len:231 (-) Transcript_57205:489-1181(-)